MMSVLLMNRANRKMPRSRPAFTLIEMLVVLGIIVLLVAMLVPLAKLITGGRAEAGWNTVKAAVEVARRYATRVVEFERDLDNTVGIQKGNYSGVAIVFGPSNELRLVENDQNAEDGSGDPLELKDNPQRNGYKDIPDRDWVYLPRGVGVVGIARNQTDGLVLYAPPFAIRFDEYGHLIAAQPSSKDRLVYYDGNLDGRYQLGSDRPNNYNPAPYDPEHSDYNTANLNKMRFEELETVVGVVVFDKGTFYDDGFNLIPDGSNGAIIGTHWDEDSAITKGGWILHFGRTIFFNRYTGTMIRDD